MLGFSENLSEGDAELFLDITQKHRSNVTMLIDRGDDAALIQTLNSMNLDRVGGSL